MTNTSGLLQQLKLHLCTYYPGNYAQRNLIGELIILLWRFYTLYFLRCTKCLIGKFECCQALYNVKNVSAWCLTATALSSLWMYTRLCCFQQVIGGFNRWRVHETQPFTRSASQRKNILTLLWPCLASLSICFCVVCMWPSMRVSHCLNLRGHLV